MSGRRRQGVRESNREETSKNEKKFLKVGNVPLAGACAVGFVTYHGVLGEFTGED
tara:strand:+ start:2776 stop:2940 length:165 start_codon:yes stop_codon:yes gene_type:complete